MRSRFVMGPRLYAGGRSGLPRASRLTSALRGLTLGRAVFSSVRTPRVYEHIVEQIEAAIFDGRLGCGDRLPPERELVRQFRASRVAVREALRTLEHRGLIEVRHGSSGGHFVRHVDAGLLRRDFTTLLRLARVSAAHLPDARLLTEPETARLAAHRATDADLKALGTALDERVALAAGGGHPRALDIGFHRLPAGAGREPGGARVRGGPLDPGAEGLGAGIGPTPGGQ